MDEVPRRSDIKIGQTVWGVEKRSYKTGELTKGEVDRILTNKEIHPRGIKVMLTDGTVVRVQRLTQPAN
ncbi:YwbE family protein [candidate division WWE3 bacterium]|uniref:YwbE family protein n=1 Tax=candidate division WWE3 bacterium TaxID=2053526 RepID=A0A955RSC8_UNCKA|nr:YwbE family protein [candidate division WWE3 bacterium]